MPVCFMPLWAGAIGLLARSAAPSACAALCCAQVTVLAFDGLYELVWAGALRWLSPPPPSSKHAHVRQPTAHPRPPNPPRAPAGSGSGRVLTLQCPSLEVYSYWPAHTHAVSSLVPLPGADCCLSVAPDSAVLCNAGGVRFSGHVHQQARRTPHQRRAPPLVSSRARTAASPRVALHVHVRPQASSQLLCACLEPGGGAAPRAALLGTSAGSVLQMDLASGKTSQVVRGAGHTRCPSVGRSARHP